MSPVHASLDSDILATLWGVPPASPEAVTPGQTLGLSRFAWIRRERIESRPGRTALIAETSLGPGVVVLEDARAAVLLHALTAPRRVDAGLAAELGLPLVAASEVVALLLAAQILLGPRELAAEDEPPLAVWEFPDLLFQARSRSGRHHGSAGGTYRFRGSFPSEPALPPPRDPARAVSLPRPDWERLEREDPPLAHAQSLRVSTRRFGPEPLTVGALAELLYRVARVDDVWDSATGPDVRDVERFVSKPYPSGGALYELEFHVVVQGCDGLAPGIYHYAGDRHVLEPIAAFDGDARGLVEDAAGGMGIDPRSVQVVLVLTARMGRIAWKYQSLALSLVLKHVGVVLQTMYLSAAAMGIGACAVGSGDSDRFARATGIDIYAEPAVGEMVLGSLTGEEP